MHTGAQLWSNTAFKDWMNMRFKTEDWITKDINSELFKSALVIIVHLNLGNKIMRIIIITLGAFVIPYLLKVLFNLFRKQKKQTNYSQIS